MKTQKLTRWEKGIQDDFRKGRYKEVPLTDVERRKYINAAKATPVYLKSERITLRLNESDLRLLREKAFEKGKKYQTFIGEILHREAHKRAKAA